MKNFLSLLNKEYLSLIASKTYNLIKKSWHKKLKFCNNKMTKQKKMFRMSWIA